MLFVDNKASIIKSTRAVVVPPRLQMAVMLLHPDIGAQPSWTHTCSTGSRIGLNLTVQQAAKTTSGWATIRYHGEENSIHPGGKSRRRRSPATPEVSPSGALRLSQGFLCLFDTEAALTANVSYSICILLATQLTRTPSKPHDAASRGFHSIQFGIFKRVSVRHVARSQCWC